MYSVTSLIKLNNKILISLQKPICIPPNDINTISYVFLWNYQGNLAISRKVFSDIPEIIQW